MTARAVALGAAAAASGALLLLLRRLSARRRAFPAGFLWATATASYQVEGATEEGGRTPSTWDMFCHSPEGHIANGDTGDEACLFYHKYPADVALAARAGGSNPGFRLSLSWSRIMPARGRVNPEGVRFYRRVLQELTGAGVAPLVTLFHWDTPQWCEDDGGWSSERVVEDFAQYADTVFAALGDLVPTWITINEPWVTANFGYGTGVFAPGKKDVDGRATYRVAHHQLLAHVAACRLYRSKYRSQGGRIGIALNGMYFTPLNPGNQGDCDAAQRANEFELGWFADPLYFGDYPQVMKNIAGDRLPTFSSEQKQALADAKPDFFALNHYTSNTVTAPAGAPEEAESPGAVKSYFADVGVAAQPVAGARQADPPWLQLVPWGLRNQLVWIHDRYGGPQILITENGCACLGEASWSAEAEKRDVFRQRQITSYLNAVWEAVNHYGCDVIGYTYWSLMDNFEWADGYNYRFGLVRVDFSSPSKVRTEKDSFHLYAGISATNAVRLSPAGGPKPQWRR